jgi:hypothetical protein
VFEPDWGKEIYSAAFGHKGGFLKVKLHDVFEGLSLI